MKPIKIFESYLGKTARDYLYDYFIKPVNDSVKLEPNIHKWEVIEDTEIRIKDLDEINKYSNAFDKLSDASENAISDLCDIATGYDLNATLEDVLHNYLDNRTYNVGHALLEYIDDNKPPKEDLIKLNQLAKEDKNTFEAIIGYTKVS